MKPGLPQRLRASFASPAAARATLLAARAGARDALLAARAVRSSGLLTTLQPRALARFALDSVGGARGPSLVLRFHAFNAPDRLALVDDGTRLSYADLEALVNRTAHGLRALGVARGSRVAVMMGNCHEYLVVQWAVTRLGAVLVQLGYRLKPPEIAFLLEQSRPSCLIVAAEYAETALAACRTAGQLREEDLIVVGGAPPAGTRAFADVIARGNASAPPLVDAREGAAVMVFTSGTTGKPKGASRSLDRSLHGAVADFIHKVGLRTDDRHLCVCPLYHSAPPALVMLTYGLGGTCVLQRHFDPEATLALIERERISSTFMVPTMLGRIAALPPATIARYDTSSLRRVITGAAPLPSETARRFEAAFGPVLYNFYGATETGMVTLALPGEHSARPGTIGRALAGNDIRLLDDDGRPVAPGEPGELYVRSSMLVAGYHQDDAATRSATRDGYFSVGDVATVDRDGYYFLASRKSDMVISGGVNIYPQEIEQRLHQHPAVLEAAVVGVPDPDWGESLVAFIVPLDGAAPSAAELIAFCKETLADFKCPRRVEFVPSLPRTPTGKVIKRELSGRG